MSRQHCVFMLNIANIKNINKMLNCMPQKGGFSHCSTVSPLFKDKSGQRKKNSHLRLGSGKFKVMVLCIKKNMRCMKCHCVFLGKTCEQGL